MFDDKWGGLVGLPHFLWVLIFIKFLSWNAPFFDEVFIDPFFR